MLDIMQRTARGERKRVNNKGRKPVNRGIEEEETKQKNQNREKKKKKENIIPPSPQKRR